MWPLWTDLIVVDFWGSLCCVLLPKSLLKRAVNHGNGWNVHRRHAINLNWGFSHCRINVGFNRH